MADGGRKSLYDLIHEDQNYREHDACGIVAVAEIDGSFTRRPVEAVMESMRCMNHRGGEKDDGAGMLMATDKKYFQKFIPIGKHVDDLDDLAVAVAQFNHDVGEENIPEMQTEIERKFASSNLMPLGWRRVPINKEKLSRQSEAYLPHIYQLLLARGYTPQKDFPKRMFEGGMMTESEIGRHFWSSTHPKLINYKATTDGARFRGLFPDLEELTTNMALGHDRYMTNSRKFPKNTQPFGFIGHNGELNIEKLFAAMEDLTKTLSLDYKLRVPRGSDSAHFDQMIRWLISRRMSLKEALRIMLPQAVADLPRTSQGEKMRTYYEAVLRAMDMLGNIEGPAAIVGIDGTNLVIGSDRMGLRPLRWTRTKSELFVAASEIGSVRIPFDDIGETGCLGAGKMAIVDPRKKRLYIGDSANDLILSQTKIPYEELAREKLTAISSGKNYEKKLTPEEKQRLTKRMITAGWRRGDIEELHSMLEEGKQIIQGMGRHQPLSVFSKNAPSIYEYWHQLAAVVTNPPIDSIREAQAIDMTTFLGKSPTVRHLPKFETRAQYKLSSPIIDPKAWAEIVENSANNPQAPKLVKLDATFQLNGKSGDGLGTTIQKITNRAIGLMEKENSVLVLTDRDADDGNLPVPMPLLVTSIMREMKKKGLLRRCSLVIESSEVRSSHDIAVLLAEGASAVHPYAIYDSAGEFMQTDKRGSLKKLQTALDNGLKTIMAKRGISTVNGYRLSRLFEVVGLSDEIKFAHDLTSYHGGLTYAHLEADIVKRHNRAQEGKILGWEDPDFWTETQREFRDAVSALYIQGDTSESSTRALYRKWREELDGLGKYLISDMMGLQVKDRQEISLEEVESVDDICKNYFRGGGMSYGALSPEAYEAVQRGLRKTGAKGNSGEGGEPPELKERNSNAAIHQLGTARFGSDIPFLMECEEIQIKINQGAKPGEGGMLPAGKLTVEIAALRKTQPWIDLISPPPHHDIYSIEDLKNLIYCLKQVNPRAKISIKVASVTDLGIISEGIVKADMLKDISEIGIEICDFTGGTGAAYRTSVNNAGLPKERGIREVHETLMKKGMRRKGHITADGSVRHGLDIVRSVILGADSAAFGTALIMAQGCIMCHHCNHDNDAWKKDKQNNKKGCPTGLTTQSEEYRRADHLKMFKKLSAQKTPEERIEIASEYIKNYLRCVAEEIREICAKLGVKRLSDLRGRVYLLKQIETGDSRTDSLKLAPLLTDSSTPSEVTAGIVNETHDEVACLHAPNINERVTEQLETFFDDESQQEADLSFDVTNEDRAIGSRLSGQMYYVLKKYPNKKVNIRTHGYAGHGYGFAASSNMTLRHTGYANDSVGSMLNEAATIILTQPEEVKADSANASGNIICGKSCLYGSTGGEFYGEGCSDDRFAVRNSGARAVVEGTGKFACEYMTGGIVTILGPIGEQLGSGMSGGEVFLYQEQDDLPKRLNDDVLPITLTHESEALLQTQITNDLKATGSAKAAFILENWETEKHKFIHVLPKKEAEKRAKEILQEAAPA